jgi:hypothetical protein
VSVPKVVQPDRRDAGSAHQPPKCRRDLVRAHDATVLVREDQAVVHRVLAPCESLPELIHPAALENLSRTVVDRDDTRAGAGLRPAELRSVAGVGDLPLHDDVEPFSVDVRPVQPKRLTASQAREEDEVKKAVQPVV